MAGLSGEQAVIDVVALSERLCPSEAVPAEAARRLELAAEVTAEIAVAEPAAADETTAPAEEFVPCVFGHQNHRDFRFCATCGVPMSAEVPLRGEPARPRPAAVLTLVERAERDRKHAEAVALAARFDNQPQRFVPAEGEAVLIHFVADGLTAFGQVWYRGQELAIGPSHPRWPEALGWITLDKYGQVERWGEQKFDFGPWPGRRSYADALGSFEQLSTTDNQGNKVAFAGPSEQQLLAADEAERRRGRAVPAPAMM